MSVAAVCKPDGVAVPEPPETRTLSVARQRTTDAPPRYLRARDAAQRVGLASATLATMRTRGGGPPFTRVGRAILYRVDLLDAWVDARGVHTSTSDPGSAAGGDVGEHDDARGGRRGRV